jgi:hypothetical protein
MAFLSSLSLKGYKAFGETAELALRPMTLVFGTNSAGKSAVLRAAPFLADSTAAGVDGPLAFGRRDQRYGDFENALSRFSKSAEMAFSLTWHESNVLRYSFTARNFPDRQQHRIVNFVIQHISLGEIKVLWNAEPFLSGADQYSIVAAGRKIDAYINFDGIIPVLDKGHKLVDDDHELIREVEALFLVLHDQLRAFSSSVSWLTALRKVPPRYEALDHTKSPIMLPDGEGLLAVLNHQGTSSSVFKDVSSWLKRVTGNELDIIKGAFRGDDLGSLVVIPCLSDSGPIQIDIRDTGEGISQVLPVLTLGALAKSGALSNEPLIVLEHPELHLHPGAHDDLADFLCEIVSSTYHPRCLVETHSESFLLTIQLAILDGKLNPEDVAVHWIRNNGSMGATISSFGFDDYGRPKGGSFPPGIFTEAAEQSRRITQKRNEKMKNENHDI